MLRALLLSLTFAYLANARAQPPPSIQQLLENPTLYDGPVGFSPNPHPQERLLNQLCTESDVQTLVTLAAHTDATARVMAIVCLQRRRSPAILPLALDLLDDTAQVSIVRGCSADSGPVAAHAWERLRYVYGREQALGLPRDTCAGSFVDSVQSQVDAYLLQEAALVTGRTAARLRCLSPPPGYYARAFAKTGSVYALREWLRTAPSSVVEPAVAAFLAAATAERSAWDDLYQLCEYWRPHFWTWLEPAVTEALAHPDGERGWVPTEVLGLMRSIPPSPQARALYRAIEAAAQEDERLAEDTAHDLRRVAEIWREQDPVWLGEE